MTTQHTGNNPCIGGSAAGAVGAGGGGMHHVDSGHHDHDFGGGGGGGGHHDPGGGLDIAHHAGNGLGMSGDPLHAVTVSAIADEESPRRLSVLLSGRNPS